MGRPAWANKDQWLWLSNQAAEYKEIKGNKKETAKFWPVYLDGWKERWPTPALTDVVRETVIAVSTGAATEPDSAEVSTTAVTAEPDSAEASTVAATAAPKKKKAKEPLTVAKVCKVMIPLGTVS
jgi:hypothetical protein